MNMNKNDKNLVVKETFKRWVAAKSDAIVQDAQEISKKRYIGENMARDIFTIGWLPQWPDDTSDKNVWDAKKAHSVF